MTRFLVTGGLGFIGSNFIRHLLTNGTVTKLVNIDSVSYGANPYNLQGLEKDDRYRFIKADIANTKIISELVRESDIVVNFAAETHVDRSISDPQPFLHSNVIGTYTILEAVKKSKIRLIHISTDEIYGSSNSSSFTEEDRLRPSNPYAASKASADMLVQAYHNTYDIDSVVLRCTNNFGPYQFPEKFIPKATIRLIRGKSIPVYGNGNQIRDWLYVQDFCDAILLAINKAKAGSLYNVSAGNEIENISVAKLILKILDKTTDHIEFVEDRPGHDLRYSLNSTKIREELGWKPKHEFYESMADTVSWYVNNKQWWQPIVTDKILSSTPWKENW